MVVPANFASGACSVWSHRAIVPFITHTQAIPVCCFSRELAIFVSEITSCYLNFLSSLLVHIHKFAAVPWDRLYIKSECSSSRVQWQSCCRTGSIEYLSALLLAFIHSRAVGHFIENVSAFLLAFIHIRAVGHVLENIWVFFLRFFCSPAGQVPKNIWVLSFWRSITAKR